MGFHVHSPYSLLIGLLWFNDKVEKGKLNKHFLEKFLNNNKLGKFISSETVAMDRAVEEIVRRVGDDTLVIVTADHSHTLSVSGYPGRRADITGVVKSDNGWIMRADDGHTMSILR